jgi:hypothetical protein
MNQMESVQIAEEIKGIIEDLVAELDDYILNKKKAAAKRGRKQSLELTKLFKAFRKSSVADCKNF